MIGYLRGFPLQLSPTRILLDVKGVGYDVTISLHTFSKIKDQKEVSVWTHFHSTENLTALYGFAEEEEKHLFLDLISVSGIGPSIALAALSSVSSRELRRALAEKEIGVLRHIKGVGKKTAERMLVELSDKMQKELSDGGVPMSDAGSVLGRSSAKTNEALQALVSLGLNRKVALKGLSETLNTEGDDVTLEELIKKTLQAIR